MNDERRKNNSAQIPTNNKRFLKKRLCFLCLHQWQPYFIHETFLTGISSWITK